MIRIKNRDPVMVILRALALGDLLTAVPALRALRTKFPLHHRILTCPKWLVPLAQHIDVADSFIEGAMTNDNSNDFEIPTNLLDRIRLEKAQLNGLLDIPQEIDVAVNLRGVRDQTHKVLLDLKPNSYVGFYNANVPETYGNPLWISGEHEVLRWTRLLKESEIPVKEFDLHFDSPKIKNLDYIKGAIIVHPGAGSVARIWPVERWAHIVKWEIERGNKVVITGSAYEQNITNKVAKLAGLSRRYVLAGKTNILQLIATCSYAKRIMSTDTGIAHVAIALGIPSIVLYGPMPPSRWGPPTHLFKHRVLWAGYLGEPYSNTTDCGLLKISVEDVLQEIINLENSYN